MTSIKYDHLLIMGTITRKFHQNPLKNVGGDAETRLCLQTDGRTYGRTDGRTHYYSPPSTNVGGNKFTVMGVNSMFPVHAQQAHDDE